jgi:hypothetical protein
MVTSDNVKEFLHGGGENKLVRWRYLDRIGMYIGYRWSDMILFAVPIRITRPNLGF